MALYEPPAGIADFSRSTKASALKQGWHDTITGWIDAVKSGNRKSPLFYDQLNDKSGVPEAPPVPVPWNGFPLRLDNWFEDKAAANGAAEVILEGPYFGLFNKDGSGLSLPFRIQDEYCEWHVDKDQNSIKRISFTCEPPEYWQFLASHDFALVHTLYEELLKQKVPIDDLRWKEDVYALNDNQELELYAAKGDYNPWNLWNTEKGAVHLTHPANSLNAEINLASDSTLGWPVEPDAQGRFDEIAIMGCAGVGGINRSSDPLILKGVFSFAHQGLSVALANPIGLYIAPFALGGLLDPKDNPIGNDALKFVRQSADGQRILRAEVGVPEGAKYGLEQCTLDGSQLSSGSQIARGIPMRLFGVAKKIPGADPREIPACLVRPCNHPTHPAFLGTFSVKKFASCDKVTAEDWENEAYDIPGIQQAGPAALMALQLKSKSPKLSPVPRGRRSAVESLEG